MSSITRLCSMALVVGIISCNSGTQTQSQSQSTSDTTAVAGGQENVKDNVSEKDVVKVAMSSKDFSTLVAALKQADLVTALSNAGPFTVFAPTNDAFNKLPAGTLDGLMKDDKKEDLRNILQYHVALGVLKAANLQDGQVLGMVNGDNAKVSVQGGKITLNNSVHVLDSVPAANGIIYAVDGVLLPPAKK